MSADVAGVKMIELVVRSTTQDNEQLPGSWGNAALLSSIQPD